MKPERILSSPAVRALATATIFARELGVPAAKVQQDERLYLAGPKDMLKVVHELGGNMPHLMIVGHNPGITEFADRCRRTLDRQHADLRGVHARVRHRQSGASSTGERRQRGVRLPRRSG